MNCSSQTKISTTLSDLNRKIVAVIYKLQKILTRVKQTDILLFLRCNIFSFLYAIYIYGCDTQFQHFKQLCLHIGPIKKKSYFSFVFLLSSSRISALLLLYQQVSCYHKAIVQFSQNEVGKLLPHCQVLSANEITLYACAMLAFALRQK